MINLLPPQGKSLTVREYWVRVLSVWGFLLSAVCVLSTFFFAPSYVLVQLQIRGTNESVQVEDDSQTEYKTKEDVIRKTNVLIEQLSTSKESSSISEIMEEIVDRAGTDIFIENFDFTFAEQNPTKATIQGMAENRNQLAEFKRTLEDSGRLEAVTLPISDLAREKDLPFTITVNITPSGSGG